MKKYQYKNIVCFQNCVRWHADYMLPNGKRIALHRCCCATKKAAYAIAKEEVNYMNEKARGVDTNETGGTVKL